MMPTPAKIVLMLGAVILLAVAGKWAPFGSWQMTVLHATALMLAFWAGRL